MVSHPQDIVDFPVFESIDDVLVLIGIRDGIKNML